MSQPFTVSQFSQLLLLQLALDDKVKLNDLVTQLDLVHKKSMSLDQYRFAMEAKLNLVKAALPIVAYAREESTIVDDLLMVLFSKLLMGPDFYLSLYMVLYPEYLAVADDVINTALEGTIEGGD